MSQTHNLHPVAFSVPRLMYPIPSTQTPSFRTLWHFRWDMIIRQPRPYAGMVYADHCHIVRHQCIDVGGVSDSEGCSAEILGVGGGTVRVVDVEGPDGLASECSQADKIMTSGPKERRRLAWKKRTRRRNGWLEIHGGAGDGGRHQHLQDTHSSSEAGQLLRGDDKSSRRDYKPARLISAPSLM